MVLKSLIKKNSKNLECEFYRWPVLKQTKIFILLLRITLLNTNIVLCRSNFGIFQSLYLVLDFACTVCRDPRSLLHIGANSTCTDFMFRSKRSYLTDFFIACSVSCNILISFMLSSVLPCIISNPWQSPFLNRSN